MLTVSDDSGINLIDSFVPAIKLYYEDIDHSRRVVKKGLCESKGK